MRKIFVLIVLALVISTIACGGGDPGNTSSITFDERCQLAWDQMDVEPGDENIIVNLILNREHAPDSVGAALQTCIREGWDDWR